MVLTNDILAESKQTVKDKVINNFSHIAFGTGTFSNVAGATALDSELVTKARQEYTEYSDSVVISGYLGSTEQNGNTITEAGAKNGMTGTLQSGKILTAVAKSSSVELWLDEEVEVLITQS